MDTSQSSSSSCQKCACNGQLHGAAATPAAAEDADKPPGRRLTPCPHNHHLYQSLKRGTVTNHRRRRRNAHGCAAAYPAVSLPAKEVVEFSSSNAVLKEKEEGLTTEPKKSNTTSPTFSLAKVALVLLAQLPLRSAFPVTHLLQARAEGGGKHTTEPATPADQSDLLVNLALSAFLVLLGGVFAGLTLALMGQDEVYLQVIQQSGTRTERAAAAKVLALLKKGKHWVLVTLLLSNVITNESLPIVLDRCLGGGWPAIVSSTAAIVVFGEIIPQSVSVRYGLSIGAAFAPFVLGLMYLLYPVAYPIALLLDYILGKDHGTMYNRAGLRTLVTLHKTMGVERLNDDEVTIISAVLDLKDKPVGFVMTPIEDVFTMSSDRVLDEATIEEILQTGFNRIPIHAPNEPSNFVGMLLVRTLITYDPEDAFPISSFPLATLPETKPDTSCLNILNYFQEGKSHMIVISDTPGAASGALGVLTLEDVIEELIGEEIIDESDVYVDVHRAIKREQPSTQMKRITGLGSFNTPRSSINFENAYHALMAHQGGATPESGAAGAAKPKLNPLNKASNPKATLNSKVTIKPGTSTPTTGGGGAKANSGTAVRAPASAAAFANATARRSDSGEFGTRNGTETPPTEADFDGDDYDEDHEGSALLKAASFRMPPVHSTEADAVEAALSTNNNSTTASSLHSRSANTSNQPLNGEPSTELHSYRTGTGIIESVINVQGVSKTIIEVDPQSDDGGGGPPSSTSSSSRSGSASRWDRRRSDPDNEEDPLL